MSDGQVMMGERCENCRFWARAHSAGIGICRRYPPVVLLGTREPLTIETERPLTRPPDWCGEWQERSE